MDYPHPKLRVTVDQKFSQNFARKFTQKLAEKAKFLTTQAKKDELKYVHDEIGYN